MINLKSKLGLTLASLAVMLVIFSRGALAAPEYEYDNETLVIDDDIEVGDSTSRYDDVGVLINDSNIIFNGKLGPIYTTDTGLYIDSSIVVVNGPVFIDVKTTKEYDDYGVYINNSSGGTGSKSDVTFGNGLKINIGFSQAYSSNVGQRAALAIDLKDGTEAVLTVGNGAVITTTAPETIGKSGDGLLFNAENKSKITANFGEGTKITVNHYSIAPLRISSYSESEVKATFGDGAELYNTIRRTAGADTRNGAGLSISSQSGGSATVEFGNDAVISGDSVGISISAERYDSTVDVSFGNNATVEIYSDKPYSSGIYARIDNSFGTINDELQSSISMNFGDGTTITTYGTGSNSTGISASIDWRLKSANISMTFGNGTSIESNGNISSAFSHAIATNTGADLSEIYMKFGNNTNIEAKGSYSSGIYLNEGGESSKTTLIFGNETTIKSVGDSTNDRYGGIFVYSHKQDNTGPLDSISSMTFGNKTTIEAKGNNMNGIYIYANTTAPRSNISMSFGDEVDITAGLHGIQVNALAELADVFMKFGDKVNIISNAVSTGNGTYIWAQAEKSKVSMEFGDEVNINAGLHGIFSYMQGKSSQAFMTFGDKVNITAHYVLSNGYNGNGNGINTYVHADATESEVSMEFGNKVNITADLYGIYVDTYAKSEISMKFGNKVNIETGSNGIYLYTRAAAKESMISMEFGDDVKIETDSNGINASLLAEGSKILMTFGKGANIKAGYYGDGISVNAQGEESEILMRFGEGTNIHVDDTYGLRGIYANVNVAATEAVISMKFGNKTNITVDGIMEGINANAAATKSEILMTFGNETNIITTNSSGININMPDSAEGSVISMEFGDKVNIEAAGSSSSGIDAYAYAKLSEISMEFGNKVYIKSDYGIFAYANAESSKILMNFGNKVNIEAALTGIYARAAGESFISMSFGNKANILTHQNDGYGVRSRTEDNAEAYIEFGDYLKITTEGDNAHGIYYNGGEVSFGSGAIIHTSGNNADVFHFKGIAPGYPLLYNNITATSKQGNLIGNESGSILSITFIGASKLYGDLKGDSGSSGIVLNLEDTTIWEGGTATNNLGTIDINMSEGTTWFVNKNSTVNSLNLGGGILSFKIDELNGTYYRVTTGELIGSGTVEMNVDLSPNVLDGNFLEVIGDAAGDYKIKVNHTNVSYGDDLQLVGIGGNSDVIFNLFENTLVIGDYHYKLSGEGNNTEWWLRVEAFDPGNSFTSATLGLMQFAKGVDRILIDEFKKTHNGLWMIPFYSKQSFDKNVVKGFSQDIWGIFIGTDKVNIPGKIDEYGKMYFGLFGGVSAAYQKFNNDGEGKIFSPSVGTYVEYESYDGLHLTSYVRYAAYTQNIKAISLNGDSFEGKSFTHGLNAGVEIAKTFNFNNGIYLEPKAKLAWVGINDYEYNVTGINAIVSEGGGLQARIGSRIGYNFKDCDESTHEYYIDLGFAHSAGSGGVLNLNDGYLIDLTVGKNRFEVGMGASYTDINDNKWFTDVKYSTGDGMKDIKVTLGGSWPF